MFREVLKREFLPYQELSSEQLDQLLRHYELLVRWNRSLNLTRIEDETEAVRLHYCESLFLGLKLPPGPLRVADVGSGAGFPGFPVAVLRPDLQVTLIESHHRKAVFLREACSNTPNIRVLAQRAESCEERFDWVIARAVSPQDVIALQCAPQAALLISINDVRSESDVIRVPWGTQRALCFT